MYLKWLVQNKEDSKMEDLKYKGSKKSQNSKGMGRQEVLIVIGLILGEQIMEGLINV
jgi:hypothetical protein